MSNYSSKNERIKRAYFDYLAEADGRSESTINGVCKSISRFEYYTGFKDFATFRKEQAVAFKKHLTQQKAERTGEPISKSTLLSTMNHLKAFFKWLAMQEGYRGKIHLTDINYFNLQEKEMRTARSTKLKKYPSLEQIRTAFEAMPCATELEKRDRAVFAFTILTGARITAITSLRIKHVDVHKKLVMQYPDEVQTKFSKTIIAGFFPIGDDFQGAVLDWVHFLTHDKLFSPTDPLFPKTQMGLDDTHSFQPVGLSKECWDSTSPIRGIFQQAFARVDLPYFNPHSFRDTLVHVGSEYCSNPQEFKAWSQNLGHEQVLTTFTSYGTLDPYTQCNVIQGLSAKKGNDSELRQQLRQLLGG